MLLMIDVSYTGFPASVLVLSSVQSFPILRVFYILHPTVILIESCHNLMISEQDTYNLASIWIKIITEPFPLNSKFVL